MGVLEVDLEEWVCSRALTLYAVPSVKLNLRGSNGWPDRMYLVPGGEPLFIEFKNDGQKEAQEKLQILRQAQLLHRGYNAQIHDNRQEALDAIRQAVESARLPKKSRQVLARSLFSRLVP